MQVGRHGLVAGFGVDDQRGRALLHGERCAPLTVAAVEDEHAFAGFAAQHRGQIMGLGTVERKLRAGRERRLDEKPGTAKIVGRHGVN